MTIFATGLGPIDPPQADGALAEPPLPADTLQLKLLGGCAFSMGGIPPICIAYDYYPALSAGPAPGSVAGLSQMVINASDFFKQSFPPQQLSVVVQEASGTAANASATEGEQSEAEQTKRQTAMEAAGFSSDASTVPAPAVSPRATDGTTAMLPLPATALTELQPLGPTAPADVPTAAPAFSESAEPAALPPSATPSPLEPASAPPAISLPAGLPPEFEPVSSPDVLSSVEEESELPSMRRASGLLALHSVSGSDAAAATVVVPSGNTPSTELTAPPAAPGSTLASASASGTPPQQAPVEPQLDESRDGSVASASTKKSKRTRSSPPAAPSTHSKHQRHTSAASVNSEHSDSSERLHRPLSRHAAATGEKRSLRMGVGARSRYGLELGPTTPNRSRSLGARRNSVSSSSSKGSAKSSKKGGRASPDGSHTSTGKKKKKKGSDKKGKGARSASPGKGGQGSGKKKRKKGRRDSLDSQELSLAELEAASRDGDHEGGESRTVSPPATPPTPVTPPLTDWQRMEDGFHALQRYTHDSEILNDWLLDTLAHWRRLTMRKAFAEWRRRYNEWRNQTFFYQWQEATRTRLAMKLRLYTLARRCYAHWVLRARFQRGIPPIRARWWSHRRLELLTDTYIKWRESYFSRFYVALVRYADDMYVHLGRKRGVHAWIHWVMGRKEKRARAIARVTQLRRKRWYIRWHQAINLLIHRAENVELAKWHDYLRVLGKARAVWLERLRDRKKEKELARLEKRFALGQALILLQHWHSR